MKNSFILSTYRLGCSLLLSGWIMTSFFPYFHLTPALETWVLNVGQGESVLVREPQGHLLLFDGGPSDQVLAQLGAVLSPWQRFLDLVILSHTDTDHVRGLIAVAERYRIGQFWYSGISLPNPDCRSLFALLQQQNVPIIQVGRDQAYFGERVPLFHLGSANLEIYHPVDTYAGQPLAEDEIHLADVVIKVSWQERSILLTGDLEEKHERAMLAACSPPHCSLKAEVLQIPHHGSKSGLLPDFLKAVDPRLAIIPVGKENQYHMPNPATLQKLEQAAIPIYRTDLLGRIYLFLPHHPNSEHSPPLLRE